MAAPRAVARDWSVDSETRDTGESFRQVERTEPLGRGASCASRPPRPPGPSAASPTNVTPHLLC